MTMPPTATTPAMTTPPATAIPTTATSAATLGVETIAPFPYEEASGREASSSGSRFAGRSVANAPRARRSPEKDRQWAVWVAGGLAVAVVAMIVGHSLFSQPLVININPGGGSTAPPVVPSDHAGPQKSQKTDSTEDSKREGGNNDQPEPKKAVPPKDIDGDLRSQLEGAVFLVEREKSGRLWPFATCVAVGGDTLLTTAREALQLARLQSEPGSKIWVTRQTGDPKTGDPNDGGDPKAGGGSKAGEFKAEVREIRVSGVFAALADKPDDWIYVNLGLLIVGGHLPKTAALASPEDMAKLEEGLPVACFGFTYEIEKVTRFDRFEPCLSRGKVYLLTVASHLPTRPRLLHLRAEIPKNAYGSPVVDAAGKVLGLYGESAAPPAGAEAASNAAAPKNLHYVTLVSPELINLWLRDRDEKMWPLAVPAPTSSTPTPSKKQNKP